MHDNKTINIDWLIIPIIFLASAFYLGYFAHDVFEEFDGVMQLYAGREIIKGNGYNGWPSHFWPPLYPLLVGSLDLFMSGFDAAKTVSIISGFSLLIVIYFFSTELYNDKKLALITQVFVAINPLFFICSIQAENHMLDAFFFCLSILLTIKSIKQDKVYLFLLSGLTIGLACLSRYTSYILIPVTFFYVLYFHKQKTKKMSLLLSGIFIISLPWWIYNYLENGSPFHTWQYLNIGSSVYPGGLEKWWYHAQDGFFSITDIFARYPTEYFINIFANIIASIILIFLSTSILGVALAPALLRAIYRNSKQVSIFLFLLLGGFILLVSQAFIFQEVFLSWAVLATTAIVEYIYSIRNTPNHNISGLLSINIRVNRLLIISFYTISLFYSAYKVNDYISDKSDQGQLSELKQVTDAIKNYDRNIEHKYIMSRHPARAYYLNSHWITSPLYYSGHIGDLVRYKNVSKKIKISVSRIPVTNNILFSKANYFIYDKGLMEHLPQFSFLLDINDDRIPKNFFPVYHSSEVVVYHIRNRTQ